MLKKIKYLTIAFIVLNSILITSCKKKTFLENFNSERSIKLVKIDVKGLFDPKSILIMNNYLVINDRKEDEFLFSLLDIYTLKEIRFGLKGEGPLEIGNIFSISKINEDSLIVFDGADLEGYLFRISDLVHGVKKPKFTYKITESNGSRLRPLSFVIENNKLICTGLFSQGMYAKCDSLNRITNYFIKYPALDKSYIQPLFSAMVYQGVMCQQNNNNSFACLSRGILDILKCSPNGDIILNKRIEGYKDIIDYKGNIMVKGVEYPQFSTSDKSIIGFENKHFQCTQKSIFILYSKEPIKEIKHHNDIKFYDLYAVDWNGYPRIHYKLDIGVRGFAITKDEQACFFLTNDENGVPGLSKVVF